jgi:hypothetical protein
MALLSDPRQATVVLTAGGMWTHELRPDVGTQWPEGTTYTRFLDSAGGVIDQLDGVVTPQAITYSHPPDVTDPVPAGAGFETFLVTEDGPYKIRYGRVIRKEVTFPDSPGVAKTQLALRFADNFQRSALGSKWIQVMGRTSIHNNPAPKPNGVGNDFGLFFSASAIRYFQPFSGDSVKTAISLLNPGWGKTTAILCANQQLTSFLGVQFDTAANPDALRIVTGQGPTSMTVQASVNAPLADYDRYMAFYDEQTDRLSVYKGDALTPVLTWTDETHSIPHGPGYRYLGFSWQADLLSTGPQLTNWIGQDDVGEAA